MKHKKDVNAFFELFTRLLIQHQKNLNKKIKKFLNLPFTKSIGNSLQEASFGCIATASSTRTAITCPCLT